MRTLFSYPLCPFSRKVRLVLGEKKISFTLENEPIWKKREDFLDLNPAGQVPVFIDDIAGKPFVIHESQAICEHLEETTPTPSLMPKMSDTSIIERTTIRQICLFIDSVFYPEVGHKIVYEKSLKRLMGQGSLNSKNLRIGAQNLAKHLDYFSWLLEKHTWLAGESMTLADLTLAAHLSCLDYFGAVPWDFYFYLD